MALICVTKTEGIHFSWEGCFSLWLRSEEELTHTGSSHQYLSDWPGHAWPESLQGGSLGKLMINKNVHKLLMEWCAGSLTVIPFIMYFHMLIFIILAVCLEIDVKYSIFLSY